MTGSTLRLSDAQTLELHRSGADRLELTSVWEPSAQPPPMHWHPSQTERFEVLSGGLTVELAGEERRTLAAGEVLVVPPRTAHRMWNAGPGRATAGWSVEPALRTEEMFRYIDRGLGGLRKAGLLVVFRNEFRLGRPRGG